MQAGLLEMRVLHELRRLLLTFDTRFPLPHVIGEFGRAGLMQVRLPRDFKDPDVKAKMEVRITGGPPSIPGPLKSHDQPAGERWKLLLAAGAGAS